MIKKWGKNILFSAAASLLVASMALSSNVLTVQAEETAQAADDFVTWRNKGKHGDSYVIGLSLQLGEYETFTESETFKVTFLVNTKDGVPVPEEDCSFTFDKNIADGSGEAVVQDFRFVEDGKFRIIVSGRKADSGDTAILNQKTPLPVGEFSVIVRDQDVEVTPVKEECEAVNEYGILVPISDFGSQEAHVILSDNQSDNQPEPTPPETSTPNSTSVSSGNRRSRRVDSELKAQLGPIRAVETRGTWKLGPNGTWLFLDDMGNPMTNTWVYVNGAFYHLGPDGTMQTGWYEENGKRYYLNLNGAMTTGWQLVDNLWYFMEADGTMRTGWCEIKGKWYYFNPVRPVPQLVYDKATGVVLTDPLTWAPITTTEGQMNYGEMYRNTVTPDGYRVDENGAWVN